MACFAPKARANCVTAFPTDPPIAGASTVLPALKPARMRAMCAVRYATGIPAALTSSTPSGIRQRLSFRTASHSLSAPSSETPYGPVNITRAPTGKSVPPPSSTTPAPSLPRTSGAFARGNWPARMVCSRGVTPAAVMRSRTLPSETAGFGRSTSVNPAYPLNCSALIARILVLLFVSDVLRFGGAGRKPQREPRIDPLRIALQHRVVELARGCRRLGDAVEIADVLPGLFNDRGAVVVPRALMSGDHRAWGERLDGVERSDPLTAGVCV